MNTLLITGGLGFIGSHTALVCLNAGKKVIILDDCSNASEEVMDRLEELTGQQPLFVRGSILDETLLHKVFSNNQIDGVIHFAAYKAVNESVQQPLKYFHNNVTGTISLLRVMEQHKVTKLVFSSSATVYDPAQEPPFTENMALRSTHAYGQSKIMIEQVLQLMSPSLDSLALRYFNPVGAHPSGLLGESPKDQPNNLMPLINQVAVGDRPFLQIFGHDYDTTDGTPERDYVHVMDVARAHLLAIDYLTTQQGFDTINIGTGQAISVQSLIDTYQKINHIKISYEYTNRREGDLKRSVASVAKARELLGFIANYEVEHMCQDAYRFVTKKRI
jgi:UDP-glucose 4-epimerase